MFRRDQSGLAHILLFLILVTAAVAAIFFWRVKGNEPDTKIAKLPDVWQKRIDDALKPTACNLRPAPKPPADSYQGPLIDAHFHPPSLPDPSPGDTDYLKEKLHTSLGVNITFEEIACLFRHDGTTPRHILSFFPVWPNIYRYQIEVVKQVMQRYPDMFVPFINPPDSDDSPSGSQTVNAKMLEKMLSIEPGLFAGYGEIGLYGHEGGARPLPPDSPRLQAIYKVLRQHGVKKVFFHLGEGMRDSFDKILRANRDITFIFHGDQLIKQLPDGSQDISQIDYLLKRNPNVAYGIDELFGDVFLLNERGTKKEVLSHFKDYAPLLEKDLKTWKAFIERYPDQVMWDTDRGTYLWVMDVKIGRTLARYARAFIVRLDPSVQAKYAYKNAEYWYGQ
ncbi:hypothetical protein HY380_01455 [Candidatus Saccharibacteria bacterium]|nr:hypothetical protein [Candidatus Saccharibacteria bacterium]